MTVTSTQTSRADILRGLASQVGSETLLNWLDQSQGIEKLDIAAALAGYKRVKIKSGREDGKGSGKFSDNEKDAAQQSGSTSDGEEKQDKDQPRPPERFWYVEKRELLPETPDDGSGLPLHLQGVEPLHDKDLQIPGTTQPLPRHHPLIPDARLLPFLRQILSQSHGKRLDIPGLVKKVSELRPLSRLPETDKTIPAGRVCLLLDLNDRVMPFWDDIWELCEKIRKKHGQLGLDIRILDDNPLSDFERWDNEQKTTHPWIMPAPHTVVLIISDLGLLAEKNSFLYARWRHCGRRFARAGIKPIALLPISSYHLHNTVNRYYRPVLWSKNKRPEVLSITGSGTHFQENVKRLLGFVSIAVHVEPELLRAIARLLPARVVDSGVEAAAWLHPDVQWGYTAFTIRPEKRAYYQKRFADEDVRLQKQVLELLHQYHYDQFPAVYGGEVIQAAQVLKCPRQEIEHLEWAESFMLRFVRTWYARQDDTGMNQYAHRELQRLPVSMKKRVYPSLMFGLANRATLQSGDEISEEYSADIVVSVVGNSILPFSGQFMQRGEAFFLKNRQNTENIQWAGSPLSTLKLSSDSLLIRKGGRNQFASVQMSEPLCSLRGVHAPIQIQTSHERLDIAALTKPFWASGIGRNKQGLFVEVPWLGSTHVLYWQSPTTKTEGKWEGEGSVGVDQYGLYGDLGVQGVVQRFRWMEPGTFMMGSPEDELERYENEVLHEVTLSQRFWLADTTVTQDLWKAVMGGKPSSFKDLLGVVMGNNPSRFKGGDRPVEQVSWEDVQRFTDKLNGLIPELEARLPWEAEWEYACRAGTSTPFSFGDNITPEQVNYDGSFPYHDGAKGEGRKQTVAVKSLPCNDWGLYDMHGNVWEWCKDYYQEDLGSKSVTDPHGSEKGGSRVVRGGSWFNLGGYVRSALRNRDDPAFRYGVLGFRLARGHELKHSR